MLDEVLANGFQICLKNIKYYVEGMLNLLQPLNMCSNELEKQDAKIAPTFAFMDPFGFSDFPMKLDWTAAKMQQMRSFHNFYGWIHQTLS